MRHIPKVVSTLLLGLAVGAIVLLGRATPLQSPRAEAPQAATSATPTPNPGAKPSVGRTIVGELAQHNASPPLSDLAKNPPPQSPPSRYVPIVKLERPELRYRLLERFPHVRYCDPYCIPNCRREGQGQDALKGFAELKQKDAATFAAILEHAGWEGKTEFSNREKAVIYGEYLKLRGSVRLEPAANGYKFELADTEPLRGPRWNGVPNRTQGYRIEGVIIPPDKITVLRKTPAWVGCPICLARGTKIDTPNGPVAVEDLHAGMLVWTLDRKNERVAAAVLRTSAVAAPVGHRVVHLVMQDGRELWVSPGHPTADGRTVGQLQTGTIYSGEAIVNAEVVSYSGEKTYDLLPAGDTGFYWANGILLGSTLKGSN